MTSGHYSPLGYSLASTSSALRRSTNSLARCEARAASPLSFSRRSLSPAAGTCSRLTRDLVPIVNNAAVHSVEEEVRLKELLARYSDLYLVDR